MEIGNLLPGTLTVTSTPQEARNWKVGQLLEAIVQSRPQGGQASLRIGSAVLTAQVSFPVHEGQKIALQVVSLGKLPVLQVVQPSRKLDAHQAAIRAALPRQGSLPPLLANLNSVNDKQATPDLSRTVISAIQQVLGRLPRQRDVSSPGSLRQVVRDSGLFLEAKLANMPRATAPSLGNDWKAALLQLRAALQQAVARQAEPGQSPSKLPPADPARTPSSPAIPRALSQAPPAPHAGTADPRPTSSNPANAALANHAGHPSPGPASAAATATDARPVSAPPLVPPLKDTHPQVQPRVAPSLPELQNDVATAKLLAQTESSLARLQLTQLGSSNSDGEQRQIWLLEVPVRRESGIDVMHLRIERDGEREARSGPDNRRNWIVELALSLEELGPLHARVTVRGEQVSTLFWAERSETLGLLQRHLHELRETLEGKGLSVDRIECHIGSPQPAEERTRTSGVLDERV